MNKEISLTEKQRENKKEDKRALKKFAGISALAFLVGIAVGVGGAVLGDMLTEGAAGEKLMLILEKIAVYGGYVVTTALLLASIVLYKRSRAEYTAWDEENEDILCGIETKLSYVLWFSNLLMFGSYFFFTVGVWAVDIADIKHTVAGNETMYWTSLGLVFLHLVYAMTAACIIQQKTVNLSKEISPEKSGSVYDMKFQDKWMEHCDEAERYTAYKCSFKTFKTMQLVGMVLWIVCLVGQVSFGTGAFATVIVTVFLLIQTSVYSVQGIYFAKHPSEVMK